MSSSEGSMRNLASALLVWLFTVPMLQLQELAQSGPR